MKLISTKNVLLIVGDFAIALFSVYMAYIIRFYYQNSLTILNSTQNLIKALIFSFSITFICFLLDLYSFEKIVSRKETFLKIVISALFTSISLASLYYFIPSQELGRGLMFIAISISIILQSFWHIGYSLLLKLPMVSKNVLILGTGPIAKTMGKLLKASRSSYTLSGYVNCVGEPIHVPDKSVIGNGDGLLPIAQKEGVQTIVVSLSERRGTFPVREVLDCKLKGIDIIDGAAFYEQLTGKLLIESMHPSHLIFSDGFRITVFRRSLKRIFDVMLASIGIVLALPFLIVIPAFIKIGSKGPILFKQNRVGEGEDIFKVYKFRTMVHNAEEKTGPVWSKSGDSRITNLGRFLRKTRLDELPQLFNVIRGEMSIIGPRPERPFFVESLKRQIPYYSERHCLKPGVTGWAQVRYEYGDSIEDAIEKLRYDLYYIKYQAISLDLLIVLDTIKVVIFGKGGR